MFSDETLNQIVAEIHGFVEYADEADAVDLLRGVMATARDDALEEAALLVMEESERVEKGWPELCTLALRIRAMKSPEARDAQ